MGARPPPKPSSYLVAEDEPYSQSSYGPSKDTKAHLETPPPYARSTAPASPRAAAPPVSEIPDFRKVVRNPAEVERDRPREFPRWLAPAVATVLLVAALGGGAFLIAAAVIGEKVVEHVQQKPAPIEEIDGVPVRRGLQGDR